MHVKPMCAGGDTSFSGFNTEREANSKNGWKHATSTFFVDFSFVTGHEKTILEETKFDGFAISEKEKKELRLLNFYKFLIIFLFLASYVMYIVGILNPLFAIKDTITDGLIVNEPPLTAADSIKLLRATNSWVAIILLCIYSYVLPIIKFLAGFYTFIFHEIIQRKKNSIIQYLRDYQVKEELRREITAFAERLNSTGVEAAFFSTKSSGIAEERWIQTLNVLGDNLTFVVRYYSKYQLVDAFMIVYLSALLSSEMFVTEIRLGGFLFWGYCLMSLLATQLLHYSLKLIEERQRSIIFRLVQHIKHLQVPAEAESSDVYLDEFFGDSSHEGHNKFESPSLREGKTEQLKYEHIAKEATWQHKIWYEDDIILKEALVAGRVHSLMVEYYNHKNFSIMLWWFNVIFSGFFFLFGGISLVFSPAIRLYYAFAAASAELVVFQAIESPLKIWNDLLGGPYVINGFITTVFFGFIFPAIQGLLISAIMVFAYMTFVAERDNFSSKRLQKGHTASCGAGKTLLWMLWCKRFDNYIFQLQKNVKILIRTNLRISSDRDTDSEISVKQVRLEPFMYTLPPTSCMGQFGRANAPPNVDNFVAVPKSMNICPRGKACISPHNSGYQYFDDIEFKPDGAIQEETNGGRLKDVLEDAGIAKEIINILQKSLVEFESHSFMNFLVSRYIAPSTHLRNCLTFIDYFTNWCMGDVNFFMYLMSFYFLGSINMLYTAIDAGPNGNSISGFTLSLVYGFFAIELTYGCNVLLHTLRSYDKLFLRKSFTVVLSPIQRSILLRVAPEEPFFEASGGKQSFKHQTMQKRGTKKILTNTHHGLFTKKAYRTQHSPSGQAYQEGTSVIIDQTTSYLYRQEVDSPIAMSAYDKEDSIIHKRSSSEHVINHNDNAVIDNGTSKQDFVVVPKCGIPSEFTNSSGPTYYSGSRNSSDSLVALPYNQNFKGSEIMMGEPGETDLCEERSSELGKIDFEENDSDTEIECFGNHKVFINTRDHASAPPCSDDGPEAPGETVNKGNLPSNVLDIDETQQAINDFKEEIDSYVGIVNDESDRKQSHCQISKVCIWYILRTAVITVLLVQPLAMEFPRRELSSADDFSNRLVPLTLPEVNDVILRAVPNSVGSCAATEELPAAPEPCDEVGLLIEKNFLTAFELYVYWVSGLKSLRITGIEVKSMNDRMAFKIILEITDLVVQYEIRSSIFPSSRPVVSSETSPCCEGPITAAVTASAVCKSGPYEQMDARFESVAVSPIYINIPIFSGTSFDAGKMFESFLAPEIEAELSKGDSPLKEFLHTIFEFNLDYSTLSCFASAAA